MNRRNMIGALGLTAVGAVAPSAVGAAGRQMMNATGSKVFNDDAMADGHVGAVATGPYAACVTAAADSVSTGEICLTKMLNLLANGNQAMAECATSTRQMIPVCQALQSLATQEAPLTPGIAKLSVKCCQQCSEALKPHIKMHPVCAACYESCMACIEACKAVI